MTAFVGAKLALFAGPELVVIERDDIPTIDWPGFLDFPGGGREGCESPVACALRETHEELGLKVPETELVWQRLYPHPLGQVWFFAAHLEARVAQDIRFGDEGLGWRLMTPAAYMAHPRATPQFRSRLQDYLRESGRTP
ncbi:NUDIX hydrolase [Chachezhania antarctica]|uniref:NUDIX hydrolase n=1 Tax=Chachezhania antarctica TaxID=2340860 RepID=UPI000EAFC1C6|nr:NUDIX hydrolase [Chachezhania antarctica]|tara:strand:+ start:3842 stop:4258 length:417 start_codon:yes stop_codon:yes gene_type:complete